MARISLPVGGNFPWLRDVGGCCVKVVELCVSPDSNYTIGTVDLASGPNFPTTDSGRVRVFAAQNGAASRKAIVALREGERCCWQCGHPSYPGVIIDGECPECGGRFDP